MKTVQRFLAAALTVTMAGGAHAGVSPEQAAQLGQSLTMLGAEKAANTAGTIPEFTGGLPIDTAPPGYKPGDGIRPDPFAAEKPRLVIDSKNMAEHKEQLTAVTQELMLRFPDFRIDVYPTHRSATIPKAYLDNTLLNATGARSVDEGMGLENTLPGTPFPIPQTGAEVMWNHLLRYAGQAQLAKYDSWNVDSSGTQVLATTGLATFQYPLNDPAHINTPSSPTEVRNMLKVEYTAPVRRVGEAILVYDSVNPIKAPRKAWQYLPGQRRVKLAPDICCDAPNPGTVGASTYDDAFVFNGAMDRYDWKLLGKKEMYVPYNDYKLIFAKEPSKVLGRNFLEPEYVRWELHRVWVVEATLKPGKRHIYTRRTFYIDEDSWVAVASDEYDANGGLFRGTYAYMAPLWDVQVPIANSYATYDLIGGVYNMSGLFGPYFGIKDIGSLSSTQWSPQSLAGSGIR
ncbi:Protein of unknown function [Pseudomonas pohangensis]|uniref:Outer membrane lipoprotein-sorting protein n=1 Tax=Pseudomonas pohangensis TaxID=364197 RepID=A0A1H2FA58_9PSED|nr:DUF1329 domain-containing protein [Pseudomonas pohangensis]SDU04241.1 Protein of unknown function [Pseudomonas pohangensis]